MKDGNLVSKLSLGVFPHLPHTAQPTGGGEQRPTWSPLSPETGHSRINRDPGKAAGHELHCLHLLTTTVRPWGCKCSKSPGSPLSPCTGCWELVLRSSNWSESLCFDRSLQAAQLSALERALAGYKQRSHLWLSWAPSQLLSLPKPAGTLEAGSG